MKYYTKCGREFQKSIKAETTGYHLEVDEAGNMYDDKCAKCPFVVDVKDGWPPVHKRFECRAGSKHPNHKNEWIGSQDDKNTISVRSLDHEFCESVIDFAKNHPELGAGYTQDGTDCRKHISVSCSSNKKGMIAKQELIEKFFSSQGATPDSDIESKVAESVNKTPEIIKHTDSMNVTINKENLMSGLFGHSHSQTPFGQSREEIVEIDLNLIDDLFSFEHPFAKSLKRRKGIEELADQIRHCGILQPTILRKHSNGRYEILAGHRRRLGASIAGLTKVPAILKDCDDDTAKLIVTYTNLGQRDEILPSEKAKAYKMALDAIKRVAGRPSKNGTTPLHNFYADLDEENGTTPLHNFDKRDKSINIVAEKAGESRETVRKYIRLNELIDSLLDLIDESEISLGAAVEISYLREQEQKVLEEILFQNVKIKLTEDIAKELRAASKEMELSKPIIEAVIDPPDEKNGRENDFVSKPPKPVYKEVFKGLEKQFKALPQDRAEKLALCQKEILEEVITKAINQYLDTI